MGNSIKSYIIGGVGILFLITASLEIYAVNLFKSLPPIFIFNFILALLTASFVKRGNIYHFLKDDEFKSLSSDEKFIFIIQLAVLIQYIFCFLLYYIIDLNRVFIWDVVLLLIIEAILFIGGDIFKLSKYN